MNTLDEIRSLWKAIADLNIRLAGVRKHGSPVTALNDLSDVSLAAPADDEFLRHNGVAWVNEAVSIVNNLNDLADVDAGAPADTEVLTWDAGNSKWEPKASAGAGYGKDIVNEDLEGLVIGNINGQGSYGVYAGTWNVTVAAGTTCEVIAGKMLRLHDASAVNEARCRLDLSANYECPCGLLEFDIRTNVKAAASRGVFGMAKSTAPGDWIGFYFNGVNQMRFRTPDGIIDIGVYAVDTWYNVKIYIDTMAQYACLWLNNIYKGRKGFGIVGVEIINRILCYTKTTHSGQDLDIDNLKFTHLSVPG